VTEARDSGGLRPIPPQRETSLWRLILFACLSSVLLLVLILESAAHGLLPARLVATIEGNAGIPDTTNPETMAQGAIPVTTVACSFMAHAPGGVCQFEFLDQRGDLVWPSLAVPVPATWLRQQPDPTTPNNPRLLAALTASPYSPINNVELDGLPISVNPTLGTTLAGVGVTPTAFLTWLYKNVPDEHRPPWVPGGVNPADNSDY